MRWGPLPLPHPAANTPKVYPSLPACGKPCG
nr:MAG TPA: hypothetical protein [Caudoviricetes sp.]